MDTSEKFIKMCHEAKEIQKLWKPTEADFMYNYANCEPCFIRCNRITDKRFKNHSISYKEDVFFWLPRQDQLLKMCNPKNLLSPFKWLDFFHSGISNVHIYKVLQENEELEESIAEYSIKKEYVLFDSIEQILLGFLMKFKYNKTWNDKTEKWIKNNKC